jgi:DNA sulfur modification protein DndB
MHKGMSLALCIRRAEDSVFEELTAICEESEVKKEKEILQTSKCRGTYFHMSYNYVFTAIRGKQATREYYVAMCPLKLIPKIFLFDEAELRPEIRAQRVLNKARVPEIGEYLAENSRDYVLSSITASIDGEVTFESFASSGEPGNDAGKLYVPMSARFLINDGQHRRAGIEEALRIRPELGDETISVVFFIDAGLRRSQQMFADLNRHAVRPTFSIGVLYDHRDPLSQLSRDVAEKVSVFRDMVEKEKTTISNRSTKLFTLSGIYQATKTLLGKGKDEPVTRDEVQKAIDFWEAVGESIPEWRYAKERKVTASSLREDTIHAHGVALHAIAIAGAALLNAYPSDWGSRLKRLQKIDWSRSNSKTWEGRALQNGRVSKAQMSVKLTSDYIKEVLGIPTNYSEQTLRKGSSKLGGGKKMRSRERTANA